MSSIPAGGLTRTRTVSLRGSGCASATKRALACGVLLHCAAKPWTAAPTDLSTALQRVVSAVIRPDWASTDVASARVAATTRSLALATFAEGRRSAVSSSEPLSCSAKVAASSLLSASVTPAHSRGALVPAQAARSSVYAASASFASGPRSVAACSIPSRSLRASSFACASAVRARSSISRMPLSLPSAEPSCVSRSLEARSNVRSISSTPA